MEEFNATWDKKKNELLAEEEKLLKEMAEKHEKEEKAAREDL